MEVLLLTLTIGPGLAIAIFVYLRDKYDREPFLQLLIAFFWGIISVSPAAGLTELVSMVPGLGQRGTDIETFRFAYITIAFSEELPKFLMLMLFFYRKSFFDEPFDGITYAVMIGMGFATLENVLYVFISEDPFSTALLRMLTAVPAHASFAVVMGYFVGMAKFRPGRRVLYMLMGLLSAVFFHGTYDFLLLLQDYPYIALGAIVSLVVAVICSFRAIRLHQRNSPFNPRLFNQDI